MKLSRRNPGNETGQHNGKQKTNDERQPPHPRKLLPSSLGIFRLMPSELGRPATLLWFITPWFEGDVVIGGDGLPKMHRLVGGTGDKTVVHKSGLGITQLVMVLISDC